MTCVKVVLETKPDGSLYCRVGWDESSDATDGEKVSAERLAAEIKERLLRCPDAVDMGKREGKV